MDIVVIIMGIIAVGAGIAGFVMEHSGKDSGGDTLDDVK